MSNLHKESIEGFVFRYKSIAYFPTDFIHTRQVMYNILYKDVARYQERSKYFNLTQEQSKQTSKMVGLLEDKINEFSFS